MIFMEMAMKLAGVDLLAEAASAERKRMVTIWQQILQRCNNPKSQMYSHYGARGIKCTIPSFDDFYAHLGPRPSPKYSVDRIDVNGHYAIGNIRWATRHEQATNTRRTAFVEIEGKRYKRVDLATKYGVTGDQIDYRVKVGKPFDIVVSKEPQWDTSSLPLAIAAASAKRKARTHCKRGHELSGENVYIKRGSRHCKQCRKEWRPS